MRITLNEPELELEVNKVDTPTGIGWCIIMPDDRKILVKIQQGKWETNDSISDQFVQAVGNEINRILEAGKPVKLSASYSIVNTTRERPRILKYLLI